MLIGELHLNSLPWFSPWWSRGPSGTAWSLVKQKSLGSIRHMSMVFRVQRYFGRASTRLHIPPWALQKLSLLLADTVELLRLCLFGCMLLDFYASTMDEWVGDVFKSTHMVAVVKWNMIPKQYRAFYFENWQSARCCSYVWLHDLLRSAWRDRGPSP